MVKVDLPDLVSAAICSVVGKQASALHEPDFEGNEWVYLKDCLDSTYVSSVGKYVDRFESDLSRFTGARYSVAVVNGTAALHVALKLAGVLNNDEVLVPALTFVATANAIMYCNASPLFVDVEEATLGIDSRKLREYLLENTEQHSGNCVNRNTGKVIRAVVPMHTFGHPVDIEGILSICNDFNIKMVEDAAESLGSYYEGQHTGTFGLLGIISFNGNKIITTGGGGAILTNDGVLASRAKHLTTTAKVPHAWELSHDAIGFNYRMPNLNAAVGCAQLEDLPKKLTKKRALYDLYKEAFKAVDGVTLVAEPKRSRSNYWLQSLLLDSKVSSMRDEVLRVTNESGQMTRPAWVLLSELTPYKNFARMNLDVSSSIARRLINIPSSPRLVF